jgi:ATP-dependent helicase HrpB
MPDPAQLSWLDLPPATNLAAARRLLTDLSALEGERLSAHGRKMAAGQRSAPGGDADRGGGCDSAATAAKLAAILEEPPRGGNSDLSAAFARQQGNWQQRAQQLMKRLAVRGGQPDADSIAALLASALPTVSPIVAARRALPAG